MGEEAKNSFQSIREWVVDHKLRTVYSSEVPEMWYLSLPIIVALQDVAIIPTLIKEIFMLWLFGCLWRLHAQALTLAALAGAAVVEYYDHRTGAKQERVASFLGTPQKD
ncbi:hypothetical protein C3L33_14862, partial [Rhododendron williamsianum]